MLVDHAGAVRGLAVTDRVRTEARGGNLLVPGRPNLGEQRVIRVAPTHAARAGAWHAQREARAGTLCHRLMFFEIQRAQQLARVADRARELGLPGRGVFLP